VATGPDFIIDYLDQSDYIGLGDGLTFDQIQIEQGFNLVEENLLSRFTIINGPDGKLLDILANISDPSLLTEKDFKIIGDTGLGSEGLPTDTLVGGGDTVVGGSDTSGQTTL
jgi:hypothetical protein